MPESRQIRIAALEANKKRCRRFLEALRIGLSIEHLPRSMPRDKISEAIQQKEAELRSIEDELHDLYVRQIREESSGNVGNARDE
jgi:hypothetical protein